MNTRDDLKHILCFGDSNTWGSLPTNDELRYPASLRWTGILQKKLGDGYEVIEEGLKSRYINISDPRPGKEGKNAMEYIIPCIESHDPVHHIITMLGTNDMRARYGLNPLQVGESMENFIKTVLSRFSEDRRADIIIVSPPYIDEQTSYTSMRYEGAAEKSKELGKVYADLANTYGVSFLDAGPIAPVGSDGIHLTEEGHAGLASALADFFK